VQLSVFSSSVNPPSAKSDVNTCVKYKQIYW
jgi:hypothetical protein